MRTLVLGGGWGGGQGLDCGTELETVTFYPKWNIYLAIIGGTRCHVC